MRRGVFRGIETGAYHRYSLGSGSIAAVPAMHAFREASAPPPRTDVRALEKGLETWLQSTADPAVQGRVSRSQNGAGVGGRGGGSGGGGALGAGSTLEKWTAERRQARSAVDSHVQWLNELQAEMASHGRYNSSGGGGTAIGAPSRPRMGWEPAPSATVAAGGAPAGTTGAASPASCAAAATIGKELSCALSARTVGRENAAPFPQYI
ncbi:unnamed protein product [Phaeothamnion confervicola]